MGKKDYKYTEPTQSIEEVKDVEITHYAFSMIENSNNSYSVVSIGFNPDEKYVKPTIEVIETNTDKYIIQDRLGVLLIKAEI